MTELVYLILATLGSWDVLRRVLPVRLPGILPKITCAVIAWALYKYAPRDILLPLCVPGVLLLISPLVPSEPWEHWGTYVTALLKLRRKDELSKVAPGSRVGHRVPRNF